MKRIVAGLVGLALLGCGEGPQPPQVAVRDSAGIQVVEHGPGQLENAERWALGQEPALEVKPPEEGGVHLFQVSAVVPLGAGGVAVANGGSPEVLVFDGRGELVRRVGRPGDGPGEFRSIASLLVLGGDSLGVYDSRRRRLSVFDGSGALAREVDLAPLVKATLASRLLPLGLSGEAVLFTTAGFPDQPAPGVQRALSESVRISRDGERLSSYGSFPGNEVFIAPEGAGMVLFGQRTFPATAGDLLVVGTGEGPELRCFSPQGSLVRIVRWPDADRTVTPERVERFFEVGLARMPEGQRGAARVLAERMPRAEVAPALEDIIGSAEGEVWVGEYPGPETVIPGARMPEREWLVFGPDGTLRATLGTPAGFRLHAVRGEMLLGVYTDELGVESVRAYRIERG